MATPAASADDGEHFSDVRGTQRAFRAEYEAWFEQRTPHYLRAAGEALLLLGLGTAYYWVDPLANADSWDDPSLAEKFSGEAVAFDNNLASTNFILHPLAGATVYGFSRLNGLDVYSSFLYTTVSSALWEYLLEWREMVSVNDLVFTPFGGAALGEFLFHLGGYVSSAPWNGSWANQLAVYSVGLPHRLHAGVARQPPASPLPPDGLGFSSAYWHRFGVGYGVGALANDELESSLVHAVELESEIVAMPGFLRPGRFALHFDEGNFTDARLRLLVNGEGLQEADARVAAVLVGYYSQDFEGQRGAAKMLGVTTALRYFDSWRLDRRDGYAFAHLPGPIAALWARSGELRFAGRVAASVDFAAIRPLAFAPFRRRFGDEGMKSVLIRQGYAYAICGSSRAQFAFELDAFAFGGETNVALCRSLDGLDRVQPAVARDEPSDDTVIELGAFLSATGVGPFELRLETEERRRSGRLGPLGAESRDSRAGAMIKYVF